MKYNIYEQNLITPNTMRYTQKYINYNSDVTYVNVTIKSYGNTIHYAKYFYIT